MRDFFIEPTYKAALEKLKLTSIDAVFAFQGDKNLAKANLAPYRSRIEFQIDTPPTTLFLKRYDYPPIIAQFKNWISAKKRVSCGFAEYEAMRKLTSIGINTPKVIAWGDKWGAIFEKNSFVITDKVEDGVSLEKKLPDFFDELPTPENLSNRRRFIRELAIFIRKFHETGFRHRDLYLSHIFWNRRWEFCLIDFARVFKPLLFSQRYRIKDLAQLHYSAQRKYFSKTDRFRFLKAYLDVPVIHKELSRQINDKAMQMARHNAKHGRAVPFVD